MEVNLTPAQPVSDSSILGALGYQHCESQVADSDLQLHTLRGGPDGGSGSPWDLFFGDDSPLQVWDQTTPRDFHGHVIYRDPKANCNAVDCLISRTLSTHDAPVRYAYSPGGPNSNNALEWIFGSCVVNLPISLDGPPPNPTGVPLP